MRTWCCALLLSVMSLITPSQSQGQALATATGPGSYISVGGGFSSFQADYGRNNLSGGFAYVDTHPEWRVGFEGEMRVLHAHVSDGISEAHYEGGVRVLLWPRLRLCQPYAKFLAGAGLITLPYGYAHGGFLTYAPGAGVDIPLTDRISVRALDFEFQHWPQFTYGALSPYGISTGISIRLNSVSRFPKGARARR